MMPAPVSACPLRKETVSPERGCKAMNNITELIKDIWLTCSNGARKRDRTVLGLFVVVVISVTLIILGLVKP